MGEEANVSNAYLDCGSRFFTVLSITNRPVGQYESYIRGGEASQAVVNGCFFLAIPRFFVSKEKLE